MKERLLTAALIVAASLRARSVVSGFGPEPRRSARWPGGTMGGPHGDGMTGGMMGMMNMMGQVDPQQMNRMVENCNRMMESQVQPPNGQDRQPEGRPEPKG